MTKSKSKKQSKKQFKSTFSRINPPVKEGADFLVDYLFRVIIFLFPLYIYETKAVMGITGKDLLVGIIVLIVGLWCLYKSLKKNLFQSLVLDAGKAFGVLVFLALLIVFGIQFLVRTMFVVGQGFILDFWLLLLLLFMLVCIAMSLKLWRQELLWKN